MTKGQPSCAYEGCDRVPHKTSSDGHCIFHAKAEDKTVEDFRQALEKYLGKLKEGKDAVYDFVGFIFPGHTAFKETFGLDVFEKVSFSYATFEGNALFDNATFKGNALFDNATFKGNALFDNATFKGNALFDNATFEGNALFDNATFKGNALFDNATFKGTAWFVNATFEGDTSFGFGKFKGDTWFDDATFEGDTSFDYATFESVSFDCVRFRETASISPSSIRVEISFSGAIAENILMFPLHLEEEAQVDFEGVRLRNTNIRREDVEGHIKQERNGDYWEAQDVYRVLKNNFHTIGKYDDESWAFLQEKEMERKSFWRLMKELQVEQVEELPEKLKKKGLKDYFYPVIFYSGRIAKYLWDFWLPTSWKNTKELVFCRAKSFRRPLACVRAEFKNFVSSMTMNEEEKSRRKVDLSWKETLKALLFYLKTPRYKSARKYFKSTFLKWLYGWGEKPWRIFIWCGVTIFIFSGLYCLIGDVVTATNAIMVKSYLEKLYFSGITFTTLGFGGYSPMGGAKLLAFIESFLGIFSIALFVYSFARRTAGR